MNTQIVVDIIGRVLVTVKKRFVDDLVRMIGVLLVLNAVEKPVTTLVGGGGGVVVVYGCVMAIDDFNLIG